jgi:hypothetical protein
MRFLTPVLLLLSSTLIAQASDEEDVIATMQKTFNGMAAHDGAIIAATMLADARLYSVREGGSATGTTAEEFIGRIASTKGALLERFTGPPRVLLRGRMAQVWGEYEFLRDGKFSHCGVDSASLIKTADGWKIATLAYTVETHGCKGQ